jgi:hypothetical protein
MGQQDKDEYQRKYESKKGMLIETINILFKNYGVEFLYHFRRRVEEEMHTLEEIEFAGEMLKVISSFEHNRCGDNVEVDDFGDHNYNR